MRYSLRRYSLCLLVLILTLVPIHWIAASGSGVAEAKVIEDAISSDEEAVIFDRADSQIQAVMAVQNRHTPPLMSLPDVVGTATGLTGDGRPAILVFTRYKVGAGVIPEILDGVPVVVKVTGEFSSMKNLAAIEKKGKTTVDPTARFDRPVPIGVSTGNEGECSAGTIGARVKDTSGNVYALSNNHVYALENNASIGSKVLQPGLYDTLCTYDSNNVIGTLSDFESIVFSTSVSNTVDAAIALSSTDDLGNSTPAGGYGTPSSSTVQPAINASVQKYGRTTKLTKGTITGINATVDVSYSSGTARFVNQIVVYSRKPFIKAGDSGSLLVTYPGCNPVGLLFAGNFTGQYAIANPIGDVLSSFNVTITIDGGN